MIPSRLPPFDGVWSSPFALIRLGVIVGGIVAALLILLGPLAASAGQEPSDGRRVVAIDPGHGGRESGAVYYGAGGQVELVEKDANLAIALLLADVLRDAGYEAVLTRSTDTRVNEPSVDRNGDGRIDDDDDLQARVDIANEAGASLLLSIHNNGSTSPRTRGTSTWYASAHPLGAQSRVLAELVQEELLAGLRAAGYDPVDQGANDDPPLQKPYGHLFLVGPQTPRVARVSRMPGVVGESLYVTSDAAIGDARFRQALLRAIDRQEMVDTIQYSVVPVAHGILNPNEPDYRAVAGSAVHYDYDPRQAGETIEALGYTRGPDGMFRDTTGQPLSVEIRTTGDDIQAKSILAVSDYWQRAGVAVEQVTIPQARANDREYRSIRPGFELSRYPSNPSIDGMQRYHSAQAPLPENGFTGTNKARYMNDEMDALLDRYFATIPHDQRVQVLAQIVAHVSREVVPLPLFYDVRSALVGSRVQNLGAKKGTGSTEAWNAEA